MSHSASDFTLVLLQLHYHGLREVIFFQINCFKGAIIQGDLKGSISKETAALHQWGKLIERWLLFEE